MAQSYFLLKDGIGSVIDITDSNGNILQHYTYGAFGKLLGIKNGNGDNISSDPTLRPYLTYTGREYDEESGLYYYRARYYEPALGRFLQQDPDPGNTNRPITLKNKYTYTGNNPILYTDPNGEFFVIATIFGSKLLGAAVTTGLYAGLGYATVTGLTSSNFGAGDFVKSFVQGFIAGATFKYLAVKIGFAAAGGVSSGLSTAAGVALDPNEKFDGRNFGAIAASFTFGLAFGQYAKEAGNTKWLQGLVEYTSSLTSFAVDLFKDPVADEIRNIKNKQPRLEPSNNNE